MYDFKLNLVIAHKKNKDVVSELRADPHFKYKVDDSLVSKAFSTGDNGQPTYISDVYCEVRNRAMLIIEKWKEKSKVS